MRNLVAILALVMLSFSGALAEECQAWREKHESPPRIAPDAFTMERAQLAVARVQSMLESSTSAAGHSKAYRQEEAYIRGYLLLQELERARRNREHDADEMMAFCRHWELLAYGQQGV